MVEARTRPSWSWTALSSSKMFVAGVFAGTIEALATTPVEVLKVHMQNAALLEAKTSLGVGAALRGILRDGGPMALYRGAGPRVLSGAIGASVLFGVNGKLRTIFAADSSEPLGIAFLCAALGTGVAEAVVYCPIDLVRTRVQANRAGVASGGSIPVTMQILREEGIRGLYRGFSTLLPKESIGNLAYFTTYELSRQIFGRETQGKSMLQQQLEIGASGALAGASYAFLIHPLDTVKTILQAEAGPPRFRTPVDCALHIYAGSGVAGIYAGLGPSIVRAALANACTFVALEYAVSQIDGFLADSARW
mmetsp:Transcript_18532/g.70110  ORF Transcript_18532/g.70110 Transcript_18532/m.70110 type:complete len:307 (-) Transcript_18532:1380-2300(-)